MSSPIDSYAKLEVPIIVRLGAREMPVREVLALVPGSIIELPKQADEELDLLVNNRRIGTGTAVKIGENFGIRISYVGSDPERAKAAAKREHDEAEGFDPSIGDLAEKLMAG
ncbi:MAG: FliM/FliN family flagellar motor switch protein [Phycisphaerales bacterium JB059]